MRILQVQARGFEVAGKPGRWLWVGWRFSMTQTHTQSQILLAISIASC